MKNSRPSKKNGLLQIFKQKCKDILKTQPKAYLLSSIKDGQINIDISQFTVQDLPCFQILLTLTISKLYVSTPQKIQKSPSKTKNNSQTMGPKLFTATSKFKQFMQIINNTLINQNSIKILIFQRVSFTVRALKQINEGLKLTKSLRQLGFKSCELYDQHLQCIKTNLGVNSSLITLDLSFNSFKQIGGMIGKIVSQHSRRRDDKKFYLSIRGEVPAQDISNTGLCQINLQKNNIDDNGCRQLCNFLNGDNWTRCINLKNNQIGQEGIKCMALLLKNNTSLISLDLRGNQGLTKQLSRYIYKKLLLNMQKYKQIKEVYNKSKQLSQNPSILVNPVKQGQSNQKNELFEEGNYKTIKNSGVKHVSFDQRQYLTSKQIKNNITVNQNKRTIVSFQQKCHNCKNKTLQILKLQKHNLDLELQLRRVKNALLTKNIDISAIQNVEGGPTQHSIGQWLSNRSNQQNDDQLLQRMQQIMMELTRVLESVEQQQATLIDQSNPLDNPNSFSNTLPLFDKSNNINQLSKSIQNDRQLLGVSLNERIQS